MHQTSVISLLGSSTESDCQQNILFTITLLPLPDSSVDVRDPVRHLRGVLRPEDAGGFLVRREDLEAAGRLLASDPGLLGQQAELQRETAGVRAG